MTLFKNIMTTIHSQKQEKQTQTMENGVRQRKPIPFSWRLEKEWCKNGDWDVWHRVFGSDSVKREMGKTVNSQKNSRENTKKKKN